MKTSVIGRGLHRVEGASKVIGQLRLFSRHHAPRTLSGPVFFAAHSPMPGS